MSIRHHYRRKAKPEDIDVTPLLNVMVVLIAFLIFSAVFSRISIQEIILPTQSGGGGAGVGGALPVNIDVIVRRHSLEIADGNNILASFPVQENHYATDKLSAYLLRVKQQHPDKQDINILLDPDISYDSMIQIMDAVKIAEIRQAGQINPQKFLLFPQISLGEAP